VEEHHVWVAFLSIVAGLNLLLQGIMLKLFFITRTDCRTIMESLEARVKDLDCRDRHRTVEASLDEIWNAFDKHGHEGLKEGARVTR
jgi:hypothetical protein